MKKQSGNSGADNKKPKTSGVMYKIFSSDNPLMKALAVVADLLLVNVLTVLLCIPVVTIGPAFIAMHEIVIQIARGEEGYIIKPFFQSFVSNMKQGLLMSLILVLSAGILYFDYLAASAYIPEMKVGIIAIAVIILVISFYAFALFGRYENTFGATLKNAAALAVGFFPRTLFMAVCSIGLWVICIQFYRFGVPILLLLGLSLPCYVNILLMNSVFRKIEGEENTENSE